MQRVKTPTAVAEKPAYATDGTPGFFRSGDPVQSVPATVPGQDWFNQVQEELVNVILEAGLTLDPADDSQLYQAVLELIGLHNVSPEAHADIRALIPEQSIRTAVAGGTANALTATISSTLTSLPDGFLVSLRGAAGNTSATPTFELTLGSTSTGAKTIVRDKLAPVIRYDIKGAGSEALLKYNASADKWVLLNPANPDQAEYGSFDPIILGTTTPGTGTYNYQQGFYRKINDLVLGHIGLDWSAHNGAGNMKIGGLPFTVATGYNLGVGGGVAHRVSGLSITGMAAVRALTGTTTLEVFALTTSGNYSALALDTAVANFEVDFSYYTND